MNEAQQNALDAVKRGENIFLTGPGGTGKSYTIGQIVKWARDADVLVAVTAMTGCAALLLNAKTLHSWAGVGLAAESPSQLAAMIEKKSRSRRNVQDTKLLIVDEVSMMTPEFFEKLDLVFQRVRRNQAFFGGLQLVLAGDFCQLPPVSQVTTFAFESPLWVPNMKTCALTEIVRQKDPVFQRILNEARMGTLSPESIAILKSRVGLDWSSLPIKPTLIFSRNKDVDRINQENMLAIEGPSKTFAAQTVYKTGTKLTPELQGLLDRLDKDSTYEPVLDLKVGAQVMLITNSLSSRSPDLVNGSRGVVTGFSSAGLPLVQFASGLIPIDRVTWNLPEGVGRSQIPLRIAYAITVHKSQGVSLDSALIDIGSSVFEYGQAYVALSRVRSLEGLYIHRLQPHAIVCHPKVRGFYTDK